MPKYTVIITRDVTESTYVEIEAPDAEQAEDLALAALREKTDTVWVFDDGSNSDSPYVTDVSEHEDQH